MPLFSIITACKDRLPHLRHALPTFVAQKDAEVIVVDFSCSQGTSQHIGEHFSSVRTISVAGKNYFSNWEARNIGASQATGDWLVFVDADVLLESNCTEFLSTFLKPGCFARVSRPLKPASKLANNSLWGFQVINKSDFERVNGYDDVLFGWGAGGDMDMVSTLKSIGVTEIFAPASIIHSTIQHDDELRFKNTGGRERFRGQFLQNLVYREMKKFMVRLIGIEAFYIDRMIVFESAKLAAQKIDTQCMAAIDVIVSDRIVPLGNAIGLPSLKISAAIKVTVSR